MKTALNLRENSLLACDGGGVKGVFSLQLLKKIEAIADAPCHRIFDAIAGTSTGGIIAGLLGYGLNATEVEALYINFVSSVFIKRNEFSGRYFNLPKYTKDLFLQALENEIGVDFLVGNCFTKVLITAKNISTDKEIICPDDMPLLRAIEATMSAPTYFSPMEYKMELYADGGTTTFNNPTSLALTDLAWPLDKTTVISIGTGYSANTKANYHDNVVFWIEYIMNAAREDASKMQMEMLRAIPQLDLRRFQALIPPIEMDDVTKFAELQQLGQDFAATLDFLTDPGECHP